jgi:hypothetical protein
MSVSTVHPEYSCNLPKWNKITKVINNEASEYIRTLEPQDQSRENLLRNEIYKAEAVLVNFTSLTLEGLAGLIYRKKPQIRLPKQLEYVKEDCAEDGTSLIQFSRNMIVEMIKLGRVGALVDFPRSEGDLDVIDQNLQAKLALYESKDIINWNTARVNGKLQLTLVVLEEKRQRLQDDGFSWRLETQYRVLRLVQTSPTSKKYIYKQFLYTKDNEGNPEVVTPKDFNGQPWEEIPFIFAGSEKNGSKVNKSPLLDIALLNIAHYKNSADLEESGHVVGQPTLIMKFDGDADEFAKANPDGLKLGCRGAYNVGAEGDAKFLQVNPNQLISEMMKDKIAQAALIGARLIAPAGGRETAEAARMRFGSSNSALAHLVDNADAAINQLLKWLCKFEDGNEKQVTFKLNHKFFDENIDPQVIMQAIMLVNEEIIPRSAVQDYVREVGFLDEDVTNEALDKEIEKTSKLNQELLDNENQDNPPVNGDQANGINDKGQANKASNPVAKVSK